MNTYFIALCLLFSFAALGRDLSGCRNSSLHKGHSIPFGVDKKFVPGCAPSVLYTWQDSRRVEGWIRSASKKDVLPLGKNKFGDSALFLWTNPIGTFAYGDVPVRVELHKNVKFKYVGNKRYICKERGLFFRDNKVYVRFFKTALGQEGSEYIICDSTPVKKWSIYTKLHYEELLKSLNQVLFDRAYKSWEPYIKNNTYFNAVQNNSPTPLRFQKLGNIPQEIKQANLVDLYQLHKDTLVLGYNVDLSFEFWEREILLERMLKTFQETQKGNEIICPTCSAK